MPTPPPRVNVNMGLARQPSSDCVPAASSLFTAEETLETEGAIVAVV